MLFLVLLEELAWTDGVDGERGEFPVTEGTRFTFKKEQF